MIWLEDEFNFTFNVMPILLLTILLTRQIHQYYHYSPNLQWFPNSTPVQAQWKASSTHKTCNMKISNPLYITNSVMRQKWNYINIHMIQTKIAFSNFFIFFVLAIFWFRSNRYIVYTIDTNIIIFMMSRIPRGRKNQMPFATLSKIWHYV